MDPSRRFVTLVLAVGVVVLLGAIALGERMGDRVIVNAVDTGASNAQVVVTPLPVGASLAPYGPDWKSNQTLAAAPDPGFPDPRIPPRPLPTPLPRTTPAPRPTWTKNPNLPVWDVQTPPPAGSPEPVPSEPATGPSPTP